MLTTAGLVLLAILGCLLGRVLGPYLKTCPYRLSAQTAAALPILVGVCALDSGGALRAIGVGVGAVLGVFSSGHNSRMRAMLHTLFGAGIGGLVGMQIG